MDKKKFKIYATDGKDIWEIFFITQTNRGDFYYGTINSFGDKISRHVSGKFHGKTKNGDLYQNLGTRVNLKEFQGLESLSSIAINTRDLTKLSFIKRYSGGKVTGSVFIDLRNHKKHLNINIFLLEPSKTEELNFISNFFENSQLIIFTQTNPWIVLIIYEITIPE